MKRFMVCLGFGSLLLAFASLHAEMPVSVSPGNSAMPASSVTASSVTASSVSALSVTWHNDLQSGWRESKRRGVPMLIFITTDNCTYCSAMKKNSWCNTAIRHRVAANFVGVRLTPKANGKTLSRIKVSSYPTTLAGSPDGKIIGHRIGYQPPEALHQFLSEVSASVAKSSMLAGDIH